MATLLLDFSEISSSPSGFVDLDFMGGLQPPTPIMDPNIFMALQAVFKSPSAGTGALHSFWNVQGDLNAVTNAVWGRGLVLEGDIVCGWRNPADVAQLIQSKYGRWVMLGVSIVFSWVGSKLVTQQNSTNWRARIALSQTSVAEWAVHPVAVSTLKTEWASIDAIHQALKTSWVSIEDLTDINKILWGPRPATYICSYVYRPPVSPFKLNFSEPVTESVGGLVLNFSNIGNPLVCDFDIGGVLIPPLPDLPTLDTTKPITPPKRRSYVMQPEFRCYRVIDDQEVNIVSFSLAISRSQWGFNVSLQCGSRGDRDMLFAGGPQEFRLIVNGYEFICVAEEPSVNHRFGSTQWSLAGRSSVALLGEPHMAPRSYTNADDKGIAALCIDELAGTDWDLDFDMTQFNVPAGVFSYVNKTPLEAIAQIASAIGGMIYPMGDTKTIQIRPQWPVTPWAMASATPDISIHDNVILSYSSSPVIGPLYNAVFVRGEQQGFECRVKRTGTAGDLLAQDVVDALITDPQAGRQRGTAVLADSGRKDSITIVLPVMATLPPALPGTLLGVTWQSEVYKGLVDSFSMSGSRSTEGKVTVRQTVGVLRSHE